MTQQPKRPSLADYLKPLIIEAVPPALRASPNIEEEVAKVIVDLLRKPDVARRVKSYSPQERALFHREIPMLLQELECLGYAPRELLIPRREVLEGDIEPEAVGAMLGAAAQVVVETADQVMAASSKDQPPTQRELAEWLSTCAPEALAETERRLEELWGLDAGRVRVVGWAFGFFVGWCGGVEFHAPAAEVFAAHRASRKDNPLAALLKAWRNSRPVFLEAEDRPRTIMRSGLAHVKPEDRRAGRLFAPAAHLLKHDGSQLAMPGFAVEEHPGVPTLPPTFWGLGELPTGGGPGEAIATRLWVWAVRSVNLGDWNAALAEKPLWVPMRIVRAVLSPANPWSLGIGQLRKKLNRAAEGLASERAAWPWHDPETGQGGFWRVVAIENVGLTIDDFLVLRRSAPPGVSDQGPPLPQELDAYGASNKYAYRALITAHFDWYQPGTTWRPNAKRGGWRRGGRPSQDRDAYAVLTHHALVDVLAPGTPSRRRSDRLANILEALEALEADSMMVVDHVGRGELRMLPPLFQES